MMKIFVIHPVRHLSTLWTEGLTRYVGKLESQGHDVYFPLRDTNQVDTSGLRICEDNLGAITNADEVHIAWDGESTGCLFDLGMTFALGKPLKIITGYFPKPTPHKSFASMVTAWEAAIHNI